MESYVRCSRKTVSRPFRDFVLRRLPGLDMNPAYWDLFQHSQWGSRIEEGGGVLVPQGVLAKIEGKEALLDPHRYSGLAFLQAYRRDVAPIEWSEYSWAERKARVLTSNGLDEELSEAVREELSTPVHKLRDRCYLVTGEPYTLARARAARREDQEVAQATTQERLETAGCWQVEALTTYLNARPSTRFTKLLRRLPAAYAAADALTNIKRRERAYRGLRAVADQPQQFYAPSQAARSVRVFGHNAGLVSLPREIRKVLLQDYVSVDLASAQLAIVARLWDVPTVQRALDQCWVQQQTIWPSLCKAVGLEYTADHKEGLKRMLYALCFGGGARRSNDAIVQSGAKYFPAEPDVIKRFMTVPMIADLHTARGRAAKQIVADGGGVDSFGNWVALEQTKRKTRNDRYFWYDNPASVLACQAQSVELRLLWPVVEKARASDEVDVVCWLFDGCSLAFSDASKQDRILRQLQSAVQTAANDLGSITRLEVD